MSGTRGGTSDAVILGTDSTNTQVLFNDNGTITGDAGMVYDKETDSLDLAGTLEADNIQTTAGADLFTRMGGVGLELGSARVIEWSSTSNASGAADVALARAAAGYLELSPGTAGTLDGLVSSSVFATTVSAKALANDNSLQAVFASANDVLTLRPTTTYFFEAQYFVNTGTTTHTTATAFTASSAFTSITYWAELWSTTAGTISTTAPSVLNVGVSTAVVLNATSGAARTTIRIKGIIRTNAATTVTPQIQFSADPTGTCEVAANSFFRAWPVGINTIAAFGDWA